MEQTATSVILDQCKSTNISDEQLGKWIRFSIAMLHEQEYNQLCQMYIQGRNDAHLDYYPEKHANETYQSLFKGNVL